ncbi:hypothetical protein Acr_28g0007130 [Actinidia rufa]|uniref:Uncharacterized protein n=1 Tax=Actinidia rufa TaxID=165716 RepID=A0A7J0HAG2_9ERIC|nr:hypothetical protein Acr_28g0007130 [Actinidia rufa]
MPYRGCTMNVGHVVEMKSQGHLILIVNDEVETSKVKIGEVNLILRVMSEMRTMGEMRTIEEVDNIP